MIPKYVYLQFLQPRSQVQKTKRLIQGSANPGSQVARATKCCTMALTICGSSKWNLLHVTLLRPGIWIGSHILVKICAPLV